MLGHGSYYGHGSIKELDAIAVEAMKALIAGHTTRNGVGEWTDKEIDSVCSLSYLFAKKMIKESKND